MIAQESKPSKNLQPPSGTITFLFTDIEGSTKLARSYPDRWERLRARHHAILREAIETQNGYVFQIIGDAICAAFHTAGEALQAAFQAQEGLLAEDWGDTPIKVRMGIHTGQAEIQETGEYIGYLSLSRVQRLMSAGHGGQTLLSQATRELVCDELPPRISLRDLGEHRLKDLARPERVYQLLSPDLPTDFPSLRTLERTSHNLPVQFTSFIGREKEIVEIRRLLNEKRLVTLTGPGGSGKTRLALQTAADLLEAHPNGVWLVELASLSDPALVPQEVAVALGVHEQQGQLIQETLIDYLREKDLLLILDNCEHLVEACAGLADALLHACPDLKILATSREALGIAGEVVFLVLPLTIPGAHHPQPTPALLEYEAVRLFSERAAAASPAFALTDDNASSLTQVCQRLDGIPLAIELAAARVRVLSVQQIATRLDDCFRLLTGGSRTALPRHQTLQALIDWSYDLLSDPERCLFRRLAVFAGGWTLEAAEAVCCDEGAGLDILELLAQLVNKSLVVVEYEQGQEVRYHMLETVRQYAHEKLVEAGEEEQARTQHLVYYLHLAEEAAPYLYRVEQLDWFARLEREHYNLHTALSWSINFEKVESSLPPEAGLRLANALGRFWYVRGYWKEGREWSWQVLTHSNRQENTIIRSRALSRLSIFEDDMQKVDSLIEESIALCRELGDKTGLADALLIKAGTIDVNNGINQRYDRLLAKQLLDESLTLYRELENSWGITATLYLFGQIAWRENEINAARNYLEECLELTKEKGDRHLNAAALSILGLITMSQGDLVTAYHHFEMSMSMNRKLGDKAGMIDNLCNLGIVVMCRGNYLQATGLVEEGLIIAREIGDKNYHLYCTTVLANVARYRGDYRQADELLTECLSIAQQINSISMSTWIKLCLGELARLQGDYTSARTFCAEALVTVRKLIENSLLAYLIEEIAALSTVQGEGVQAATLFGAADALRAVIHKVPLPVEQEEIDRNIELTKAQVNEEAFQSAWAEGQKMTAEVVIAYLEACLGSSTNDR